MKGNRRKSSLGFTLIEVLVTCVLLGIALVGTYQGIASMDNARAYAIKADLLQRLATEKLADVALLSDPSADGTSGDFSDRAYPDITWSLTETSTSVTNLDEITVTATQGKQSQIVDTEMYVVPAGTTGSSSTSSGSTSSSTAAAGGG